MRSMILACSILAWVAAAVEAWELGEPSPEPSCLLQTPLSPASLVATESGTSTSPIALCPGSNCYCTGAVDSNAGVAASSPTFLEDCNAICAAASRPLFELLDNGIIRECRCCNGNSDDWDTWGTPSYFVYEVVFPSTSSTTIANTAGVDGDPHIKTLDGRRYTLLTQGTFSLWRFSGVEAELPWPSLKKVPTDWQVYTHYSGHQSFTKGLLLADRTGGSQRQLLEITADDCQWRARKGKEDWTVVQNEETVAVPDGNDYLSGFIVTKKDGPNGHNHVRLNMQTKDGKTDIAVLSLSCRPKHHLNVQMIMKRRSDAKFINGQLKPARKVSLSQQMSTDSDFAITSTWQELGGSAQAAAYFQRVDEIQFPHISLLASCSSADESQAKQTCSKHLGRADQGNADEVAFLNDCIFDICHGAGETAAELAAELLASTRAIYIN